MRGDGTTFNCDSTQLANGGPDSTLDRECLPGNGATDAGPTDAFGAVLTSGYDASILTTGPTSGAS